MVLFASLSRRGLGMRTNALRFSYQGPAGYEKRKGLWGRKCKTTRTKIAAIWMIKIIWTTLNSIAWFPSNLPSQWVTGILTWKVLMKVKFIKVYAKQWEIFNHAVLDLSLDLDDRGCLGFLNIHSQLLWTADTFLIDLIHQGLNKLQIFKKRRQIGLGWFSRGSSIQVELKSGNIGFSRGRKTGKKNSEKSSRSQWTTNSKLNPKFSVAHFSSVIISFLSFLFDVNSYPRLD